ncbi:hypothetical protein L6R52_24760 [Myxococcota bacterium]|nr:hypothetical protein [Myxococcota bacterium]
MDRTQHGEHVMGGGRAVRCDGPVHELPGERRADAACVTIADDEARIAVTLRNLDEALGLEDRGLRERRQCSERPMAAPRARLSLHGHRIPQTRRRRDATCS